MKKLSLLLFGLLLNISVKSQEFELFLLAKDDANRLFENYMSPAIKGMQNSLNNGWFQTAKTHEKFGFDISIQANMSMIPKNERSFLFNENDYKYLSIPTGNHSINTLMGGENTSQITVKIPEANDYKVATFKIPDGIGNDLPSNAVPSPMIQASLGISSNTDISLRFLPEINSNDIHSNLIGFGIKHNLMKYFGPLDHLPLNIALLGGYSTMNVAYEVQNSSGINGSNQKATFNFDTFTVKAIASLDFPIVSIYGGLGFNKGTSTLKMTGTYELEYNLENSNNSVSETITDPIKINFDTKGFNGTLGARINLGFFKIFGAYSINEFNSISTGIAFSFR